MQIIQFSLSASLLVYSYLYDMRFLYILASWIGVYFFFQKVYYFGGRDTVRNRIQVSAWSAPSEGLIHACLDVDLTNTMKLLDSQKTKETKVSITHMVVKALGQGLSVSKECMNGKIVFDKYIPHKDVNISCLVDVEGGKDLASILVEKVDKLTFQDIARFIAKRAGAVKKNQDKEHNKRVGPLKFLPSMFIQGIMEFAAFISYNLGLDVPALAIKKNGFSAGCVTSLGSFGFKDVFAPLCRIIYNLKCQIKAIMRGSVIVAINQAVDRPIVKNGQIVIAPIMKLNYTIDHRFIDGAKAKSILNAMEDVFENPEKYSE